MAGLLRNLSNFIRAISLVTCHIAKLILTLDVKISSQWMTPSPSPLHWWAAPLIFFDSCYDGQNGLHPHFAHQHNVCDGVAWCEWTFSRPLYLTSYILPFPDDRGAAVITSQVNLWRRYVPHDVMFYILIFTVCRRSWCYCTCSTASCRYGGALRCARACRSRSWVMPTRTWRTTTHRRTFSSTSMDLPSHSCSTNPATTQIQWWVPNTVVQLVEQPSSFRVVPPPSWASSFSVCQYRTCGNLTNKVVSWWNGNLYIFETQDSGLEDPKVSFQYGCLVGAILKNVNLLISEAQNSGLEDPKVSFQYGCLVGAILKNVNLLISEAQNSGLEEVKEQNSKGTFNTFSDWSS